MPELLSHGLHPRPRGHRALLGLLWLVLLAIGTPEQVASQQVAVEADRVPPALDHGWPVASPSSVGFDPVALEALARRIEHGEHGQVDALLIVRNGNLVFERYFGGYTAYTLHTLQSVTKSVASVLVAIALQNGHLRGLDQPIHELFPRYQHIFDVDPRKREITLHHLLSMTAGFDWPEHRTSYGPENIVWAFAASHDWPEFVLSRPLEAAPGQVFTYSTGISTIIGAVIQNATGMRADHYAERHLFNPLGIPNYGWWRNTRHPEHWSHTGGGLHLSPRDLAKIGYLFLSGGTWKGRQILSPEWIAVSTRAWMPTGREPHESYGYQWWLRPLVREGGPGTAANDIVHAAGIGGQHMFVVPALDLVVIFNGTNFEDREVARQPVHLLYEQILPALRRR